jgi:tetratricopeptide (TPR) repeat protein
VLLAGLVPGLPTTLQDQILERAEGVPLYAVETVRMLLDRRLLTREGNKYQVTAAIQALEVPETLHGLMAARLDSLTAVERRLLQDAAVLGKTFTVEAVRALSGQPKAELEQLLTGLVRRELLSIQADPRSPERGQYGFVQELVRTVAYATLSKRDRAARHLAAAAWLETSWGAKPEEIVEVVAFHYLEAWRAAPEAAGAGELKGKALELLTQAGDRAASLAASEEAQRYFEQAAELADQPLERARLLERAGEMAWTGGQGEGAAAHFGEAIALFESQGQTHPAARVSARLAEVDWAAGHLDRAVERMEAAFQVLTTEEPDEDLATLAAQLGRLYFFKGEFDIAAHRVDLALQLAETLWLPEVLAQALNTEAVLASFQGRTEKALALLTHALRVALENDLPAAALRAYGNLSETLCRRDRYEEALEQDRRGLVLARKVGNRAWEWLLIAELTYALFFMGRWEEALAHGTEVPEDELAVSPAVALLQSLLEIYVGQGNLDKARRLLARVARLEASVDLQDRAAYAAAKAAVLHAELRYGEALAAAEEAFGAREKLGSTSQAVKAGVVWGIEAAFALGDLGKVTELVAAIEALPAGQRPRFLQAQAARIRARVAAVRGDREVAEAGFEAAAGMLRELGIPFWCAVTLLEHAEWLAEGGDGQRAEPLLTEAAAGFERLGARTWLERLTVHRADVEALAGHQPSS